MDEYLPPVVTRLRADLSDLLTGLAQARVAMVAWALGVRDDVQSILRDAGRDWGRAFSESFDGSTEQHLRKFDRDIDQNFIPRAAQQFAKAGVSSGGTFGTSFMAVAKPLLIGLLITALPALTTMVAAAISLGIGFGFVGLGAFLLREQEGLITAATQLRDVTSAVFKDAAMPMLEPMIKALGILKAGMAEIGPEFKPIFAEIGASLPNLATGVVGMLREMMPGLKELAPVVGSLISALAAVLPDIGKGLGDLFKSLAESGPAMIAFSQVFGTEFGHLLTIIGKVIVFFGDIFLFLNKIKTMSEEGGWSTPWEAWATFFTKIGNVVQELPGRIMGFLETLPARLGDLASRGMDAMLYWIGFGVAKVLEFFALLPERVRTEAGRMWLFLQEEWVQGVERSLAFLRSFPSRAIAFLVELRDRIRSLASEAPGWLYEAGKNVVEGLIKGIRASIDAAVDAIRRGMEKIKQGAKDALGIRSPSSVFYAEVGDPIASGAVNGVIDGLTRRRDRLRAALGALTSPVTLGTGTAALAGQGAALATIGAGGGGGGGQVPLHATINIDGQRVIEALVPAAQRRKDRTGTTGLS